MAPHSDLDWSEVDRYAPTLKHGIGSLDYFLRHGKSELPIGGTGLTIGRGAGSSIALDDALVSRRHAKIVVLGGKPVVEDLGSRNGVMVNGQKIEKETQLSAGDTIVVGSVEFVLLARPSKKGGTTRVTIADAPASRRAPASTPYGAEDESTLNTRRPDAFSVLGDVVDSAVRAGHLEEAERLLHGHVTGLLADVRKGIPVPLATKNIVARLAVVIAGRTQKGIWIDHIFELYRGGPHVPPPEIVAELQQVIRTVGRVDVSALRSYIAALKAARSKLSAADHPVLDKLVGLERVAVMAMTR